MKKEIKDYIHLYLGCEAYVFPDDTLTNGWLKDKLIRFPELEYKIPIELTRIKYILERGYKPILRKLSSMTEEEKIKYQMPKNNANVIFFTAKQVVELCKEGFDLFGLIDANLAIDKDTL
jgi:hypothetical protein